MMGLVELKYQKELYIGSGFYGADMDCEYTNETEKLVKCRKQHKCVNCQKPINVGDYALQEKALFPGDGWKSAYTCTACIEEWLEESGQVESEDKG